ncbi:NXNL1 protein, partial [Ptilonorhynchus violaceus]|nr:NXNL1 protein [Ptilonorhynchus violaceus]
MASLFSGRVLLARREEFRLDTERELRRALENKILLLYFGSGRCPRCREFAPRLREFCRRLLDEFYVERPAQLGLVYVSRDGSEREQTEFLRSMPSRWLALPFGDAFGRELERRFGVSELPAAVVLKPSGELLVGNAVREIRELGASCFQNWREAAELLDRNFRLAEDSDGSSRRSLTDPLRRLKYKLGKEREREKGEEEQE